MEARALDPMSTSGNLAQNWRDWIQKFKNYLIATEANTKAEKVQCAKLIYYIGDAGLKIYNTFIFSEEEANKIEPLIKKFEQHFVPKSSVDFERYKFFTLRQGSDSTEQFITKLKIGAKNCEFATLEEGLVKTMITIGIKSDGVREKLLQNEDLKLDKAIQLCVLTENTKSQSEVMKTSSSELSEINAVQRRKFVSSGVPIGRQHSSNQQSARRQSRPSDATVRQQSSGRFAQYQHHAHQPTAGTSGMITNCTRCGWKSHPKNKCPAFDKICNKCGKLNHFGSQCKLRRVDVVDNENLYVDVINNCKDRNTQNWSVDLKLNNKIISFKLDTGACVNLLNENEFNCINSQNQRIKLHKSDNRLVSYTGNSIPLIGKCNVNVRYKNKSHRVSFHVVKGNYRAILGLETCVALNLIEKIDCLESACTLSPEYSNIINKYKQLFTGIGRINRPYHIELNQNAEPKVHPVRKVPFALEQKFKDTLDKLVNLEIIEPVQGGSDWVNPVVLVQKKDGSLRICLDPQNLNDSIRREYYKLPTTDELISKLNGASYFTILDAASGFWNIPLDEPSSLLCTFGTPYGRYKFLRMPYGLKSAPEVFQKRFKEIFDCEGVEVYIDDILVWGRTKKEHDARLYNVLNIARKNNVKFNPEKCRFGLRQVKYVGHKFSNQGVEMDEDKVEAIKKIPVPTNKTDIQRFLGLVTYVGRFINNLSEKIKSLRDVIKKDNIFEWNQEQQRAFEEIKKDIIAGTALQYFDPRSEITISVDASQFGIGAVLMQGGKPCAYASRSLTETQRRYAQIEKELLAICFGVEKYHQYVFGQKFKIETDHKPLISIVKKPLNTCPARLQRMFLALQRYDFQLIYKPGKELLVADTLSRAFDSKPYLDNLGLEEQVCLIANNLHITDERLEQLIKETETDSDLKIIKNYVEKGWPSSCNRIPEEIKKYYRFRHEITIGNELIYKNQKIIIPKTMRNLMLQKIHAGHQGISKSQLRANSVIYWPGMNYEIEQTINKCRTCQKYANSNPREPLVPHEIPRRPWVKLGVDLFEIQGIKYLLLMDYYSKFVEVENLNKCTTAEKVIAKIKRIFSTHGVPEILISDGGPQFTSSAFRDFSKDWHFKHVVVAPHYQQANGMAERAIQTVKKTIKKAMENKEDVEMAMLILHNTPIFHNYTPSDILMSRRLRDNLPAKESKLIPKIINHEKINVTIDNRQAQYKKNYDLKSKALNKNLDFAEGSTVRFQERPGSTWKFATIDRKVRDRTFRIVREDGSHLIRNSHHLKPCVVKLRKSDPESHDLFDDVLLDSLKKSDENVSSEMHNNRRSNINESINSAHSESEAEFLECENELSPPIINVPPLITTRSGRPIRAPQLYVPMK